MWQKFLSPWQQGGESLAQFCGWASGLRKTFVFDTALAKDNLDFKIFVTLCSHCGGSA